MVLDPNLEEPLSSEEEEFDADGDGDDSCDESHDNELEDVWGFEAMTYFLFL